MTIQIPTDLTIVTLRTEGRELPQRFTDQYAASVLARASDLLKTRADITFPLGLCERVIHEMPGQGQASTVDEAGFHFLASLHPPGHGVRVLLVDRVSQRDLGGEARANKRICLVAYGDLDPTSRYLAHELGHLLHLEHVDRHRLPGPAHQREAAAWATNLMFSGLLSPIAALTPDQVRMARSSSLAKRFGGH